MSSKINRILQKLPHGTVATLRWLRSEDVDRRLADKYVRSGWLTRLGHGAYVRAGLSVDWVGGVHALQTQLGLNVHPGGITAAELRGYAHYLALGGRSVVLFGEPGVTLPSWFRNHRWPQPVEFVTTGAFEKVEECTSMVEVDGIRILTATIEQAVFEMMYLVPDQQYYEEAYHIMVSLTTARPHVVQKMLEGCTSVKTKRLFMHAAEHIGHSWVSHLDLSKVDFGSGVRSIHAGGQLNRKYKLVVEESPNF